MSNQAPQAPPGWCPHPQFGLAYWNGFQWVPPQPGREPAHPFRAGAAPQTWASPAAGTDRALWAHLGGILTGIIVPLVVYLVTDRRDQFSRCHAAEALNFQLTLIVAWAAMVVVTLLTLGIGLLLVLPLGVVALVWQIEACVAAGRGSAWRYPLNIRFVKA